MSAEAHTHEVDVLVVEDSPTQAEKVRYLIEREGYRTRWAQDGRAALQMLREWRPDVVLTDIVMPEVDGYELCRTIKSDPQLEHIPVILMTTLSDPRDIVQGLACRADAFIRKPYDETLLLSRIRDVLANRELRKDRREDGGIELSFAGQHYVIDSGRQQILDLLISSYEQAVRVNEELKAREQQIVELNARLAQHATALEQANGELARQNVELDMANRTKSRFLANASHELRTPLIAILGCSEILREGLAGPLTAEQIQHVDDIQAGGQHLLSLINDLLDLSKIEAGRMELRREPVDVRQLLQGTLPAVRNRAQAHGIRLESELAEDLDIASLDSRAVMQILFNLLSNAVKFTPDNGCVRLRGARIEEVGRPWLKIEVQDTGIGIAQANLPRMFEPFEQLDAWSERRSEGTGLGLTMVRELSQLHGGRVEVASQVGVGTCFTVYLPAEPPFER